MKTSGLNATGGHLEVTILRLKDSGGCSKNGGEIFLPSQNSP